jgi:hypothetical protein
VELGRIDIITEVSMLSTYTCLLREGHLEAVFHVFAYLGMHHNVRAVFDPTYPSVDMDNFIKTDWNSMYGDVKEIIPSDAPVFLGRRWVCACLLILVMLVSSSQGFQGLGLLST